MSVETHEAGAARMGALLPRFLVHAEVELSFRPQSIQSYRNRLRQICRDLGDPDVRRIGREEIVSLRQGYLARNLAPSTQAHLLLILRRFLMYCRDVEELPVFDPSLVRPPKRPHRDVLYLTVEEVERFVSVIPLQTCRGAPRIMGVRFRALVEVLLGSAIRIGELLSATRNQLDLPNRELRVIGKGNKERVAFLSERAAYWLAEYLTQRRDAHSALFVTQCGRYALKRPDIWRFFARYSALAGIQKPVRPHILRHTAATWLLLNGCPIGHIKEILGHARLETTCRYYLGLDRRAAKLAHATYLQYGSIAQ